MSGGRAAVELPGAERKAYKSEHYRDTAGRFSWVVTGTEGSLSKGH